MKILKCKGLNENNSKFLEPKIYLKPNFYFCFFLFLFFIQFYLKGSNKMKPNSTHIICTIEALTINLKWKSLHLQLEICMFYKPL